MTSQRGHTRIAQEFLATGEDVDKAANDTPAARNTAKDNDNAQLLQTLLATSASPESKHAQCGPALRPASLRGLTKLVESLVALEANIKLQNGHSPAAGHGEVVAILLLKKGAESDLVGGLLEIVIQAAATERHSEIVKMPANWSAREDAWH